MLFPILNALATGTGIPAVNATGHSTVRGGCTHSQGS